VLSGLYELKDIGGEGGASAAATVIAAIVAFASGYAAIAWLLRYLADHSLNVFVAYRIPLGILVIALAASGAIT
jgi:undecaprenyl-diphosphatase